MRAKILIGAMVCGLALAVTTLAAVAPVQTAVVRFLRPTIVAGTAVLGPVVFEHNDVRMARGEPCTTIYHYDARTNRPGDVIVEFMCVPKARNTAAKFEATISREFVSGPDRLLEYQFAGESEGHGVPMWLED